MSFDSQFLQDGYLGDLTALRALQQRCRFTNDQAAAFCGISPHTYRRWLTDRRPNPLAVKLLAIQAGYVPWDGWQGWEVHGGRLFPPGYVRDGLKPGDLLAIPFRVQLLAEYERQIRRFDSMADQAQEDRVTWQSVVLSMDRITKGDNK